MKTRSSFFSKAILCVLMVALTLVICFPVAAVTSTTLTTTIPETLPLILELSGKGTVTINGVAYTQSQTIEIPRNTEIVLKFTPNKSSTIAAVIYDGLDYTEAAKNSKLILPAVTDKTALCVSFTEITLTPATGDSLSPQFFVLIMFLSLMGIIATTSFKKKKIT